MINWFIISDELTLLPARIPPTARGWPDQCAHHLWAAGGAGHGGAHRGHHPRPLGPLPPCQCQAMAPEGGPCGRLQPAHSRGHSDEGPRSPGEKVNLVLCLDNLNTNVQVSRCDLHGSQGLHQLGRRFLHLPGHQWEPRGLRGRGPHRQHLGPGAGLQSGQVILASDWSTLITWPNTNLWLVCRNKHEDVVNCVAFNPR